MLLHKFILLNFNHSSDILIRYFSLPALSRMLPRAQPGDQKLLTLISSMCLLFEFTHISFIYISTQTQISSFHSQSSCISASSQEYFLFLLEQILIGYVNLASCCSLRVYFHVFYAIFISRGRAKCSFRETRELILRRR